MKIILAAIVYIFIIVSPKIVNAQSDIGLRCGVWPEYSHKEDNYGWPTFYSKVRRNHDLESSCPLTDGKFETDHNINYANLIINLLWIAPVGYIGILVLQKRNR